MKSVRRLLLALTVAMSLTAFAVPAFAQASSWYIGNEQVDTAKVNMEGKLSFNLNGFSTDCEVGPVSIEITNGSPSQSSWISEMGMYEDCTTSYGSSPIPSCSADLEGVEHPWRVSTEEQGYFTLNEFAYFGVYSGCYPVGLKDGTWLYTEAGEPAEGLWNNETGCAEFSETGGMVVHYWDKQSYGVLGTSYVNGELCLSSEAGAVTLVG